MKNKLCIIAALCLALIMCACGNKEPNRALTIEPYQEDIYVGEQITFVPSIERLTKRASESSEIIWASSDESVASVDAQGTVNFNASGEVDISATLADDERVTATLHLVVLQPLKYISVEDSNIILLTGSAKAERQVELTFTPNNASNKTIIWASSDESVVTIDKSGTLHASNAGTATITATAQDVHCTQELTFTVEVHAGVSSIEINEIPAQIFVDKRLNLTATVYPEDAEIKDYVWSSSDENIATVDAKGNVKAISAGKVRFTATAVDGSEVESFVELDVIQPITRLSAEESRVVITEGDKTSISLIITPENATIQDIEWSSSDESIATVDDKGTLTTVGVGRCTISAKTTDGSEKSTQISVVVEPYVPVDATMLTRSGYWGVYSGFYVTFKNLTATKTITGISFNLEYNTGYGSTNTKSCYFDNGNNIGPGSTRKIGEWSAPYLTYASGFKLYLNSVTFSDGTSQQFARRLISTF